MQEELITDNADLQGGDILQGTFKAQQGKDCFVDMRGFEKGFVVVNGFNIGRYWKKGPQRTLYLPAPLLKENNTITVVENARAKDCLQLLTNIYFKEIHERVQQLPYAPAELAFA